MSTPPIASSGRGPSWRLVAVHVGQTLAMFVVFGGILFVSAGRLDWWEAWAFLIVYFLMALGAALWMLRTNPELARERDRPVYYERRPSRGPADAPYRDRSPCSGRSPSSAGCRRRR